VGEYVKAVCFYDTGKAGDGEGGKRDGFYGHRQAFPDDVF
jgi:hypothetical protein